ncbi:hypothetical protein KQI65_05015 [bacterium]|nr:hypothetical protein [bacterium]
MGRLLLPLLRAYEVAEGFLAGNYPGHGDIEVARQKLRTIVDLGVTSIVNLMEEDEMHWRGGSIRPYGDLLEELPGNPPVMHRFPVIDMQIPSVQHMKAILDHIDEVLACDDILYLHCLGGVGRTGTVVGCWLARHGIATGEAALTEISRLREYDPMLDMPSPQTEQQCQMVRSWVEGA